MTTRVENGNLGSIFKISKFNFLYFVHHTARLYKIDTVHHNYVSPHSCIQQYLHL